MKWIKKIIPDLLAVSGAVCVVVSACLIAIWLGWLTAGAALIAGAVIWSRAGGGDR